MLNSQPLRWKFARAEDFNYGGHRYSFAFDIVPLEIYVNVDDEYTFVSKVMPVNDERTWHVSASVSEECEGMGTVTGGNKDVKTGAKVAVKATAAKGCAFVGWFSPGDDDDYMCVSDSASYSFVMPASNQELEARFVSARNDELHVIDDGDRQFGLGESVSEGDDLPFIVHSVSAAAISVKGLPPGVSVKVVREGDSYDVRWSGTFSKAGLYLVTCSAKNANGYLSSDVMRVAVGRDFDEDYDDIGLEAIGGLYDFRVGTAVDMCLNANLKSVTGLPPGLSFKAGSLCDSSGTCTICSDFLRGTPTKVGFYTLVFTDVYGRKAAYTVRVADAQMRYLGVNVGESCRNYGTVSGGGVYVPGATVKLSAKAAKNCYFAGWYTDSDCNDPFTGGKSGDWRTANDTLVFDSEKEVSDIYARFVTKAQDASIAIQGEDDWRVDADDDENVYSFSVDSLTVPKVTVKGLPAGIKQVGMTFVVSDRSKLSPGTSEVTVSAKNLSGAMASKRVFIRVPNLRSEVFSELSYDEDYRVTRGVSDVCTPYCCMFNIEDGWNVTAKGLPNGMSFDIRREGDSSYGVVSGVGTKPGTYTVRLTAKKGSRTEVATFTVIVDPLPDWAVGTFCTLPDAKNGIGSATLTVSESGKISGKFLVNGTTWNLSLPMFECETDEGLFIRGAAKSGKASIEVSLRCEDAGESNGIHESRIVGTIGDTAIRLWRNIAADKGSDALTKAFQGLYTIQLQTLTMDAGVGYLSVAVSKFGAKATGKLPDGTAVSSTMPLLYKDGNIVMPWFLSPTAYKGGYVGAVMSIDSYGVVSAEEDAVWCNNAKGVTDKYDEGFERSLSIRGAYYDKLANIADYYDGFSFVADAPELVYSRRNTDVEYDDNDRPCKVSYSEWDVTGPAADISVEIGIDCASGNIIVPKSSSPKKGNEPGEWSYEGENPSAVTLSLAKATGIFKGTFTSWYDYVSAVDSSKEENSETWAHVGKKVAFEGVWVQGEGLQGFYLWDMTGTYILEKPSGEEVEKTYKFKKSGRVSLTGG